MMLSNKKEIKRLAIYFFYDRDGVVDDYITYMLEDLNKNISDLLVVCNGKLSLEGRKKFEKYTSNILVRENIGFDVWAYKESLETYGWDRLSEYDELILMNYTIMGPIYPFKEMFNRMEQRDVDFWGITTYNEVSFDPFGTIKYGYIPLHIQSHFIAIRNEMLKSKEFKEHWENMPMINRYEEAVGFHEAIFTKKFEDRGYKWEAYVNTKDLSKHSDHPILMSPLELIKNRRCPIIKRRSFFHDYSGFLHLNNGESTFEMMEYIKENLDYDVNLIWDNILRTQNQADLKKCLQLNYILPSNGTKNKLIENIDKKIALVIHIYFEDLIEYCFKYVSSMPQQSDIYITTNTEDKKVKIEKKFSELKCNKLKVIVIENRGRDVSALIVATKNFIMDYDYVCFAHDKKVTQLDMGIKGEAFSYKCFENILKDDIFVKNIIDTFESNPRLGLLTPPPPNHSDYYPTISFEWGYNYEKTLEVYKQLNLTVPISLEKEPIAPLGTMFWFRPKALKKLFDMDWNYSDFPREPNGTDGTLLHAIERIYPFVVQEEGFYPAWVMVDTFAKIEVTNLNFMLRELNKMAFQMYGFNSHYGLVSTMKYTFNQNEKSNISPVDVALKKLIKEKLKRKIPKPIWNLLKKIYHLFNGKRWVG